MPTPHIDGDRINVARTALSARVLHDLTLHPPISEATIYLMDALRSEAQQFALQVVEVCPISREQSLALTKIEEALFYAIASIARNQQES